MNTSSISIAPGHEPLSPVSFLLRSARVWAERPATLNRGRSMTYAELLNRVERAAGALVDGGIGRGDRVALLLPNVPAMLEMQFAVIGIGAVLVPLNTRLTAAECRYALEHSETRFVVAHSAHRDVVEAACLGLKQQPPRVIYAGDEDPAEDYSAWTDAATPCSLEIPDEMSLLSINYTSGTTGRPKGAMYTHRGAFLHTLGVIAESRLETTSNYLWTLPMFHCNGWAYPWAVTAAGARHVFLESFDAALVWSLLHDANVTHLCAAPTVVTMILESSSARKLSSPVRAFIGGSPPSPALLRRADSLGIDVTHLYGLTETYGPVIVCAWHPEWDQLPIEEQARRRARQGVETVVSHQFRIVDYEMRDVPADGETMGEVVLRGNNVMLGYFRDRETTAAAFTDGWFHSGDLAVMHPDGYMEIRDRAKDVIISGGENISAIEVEQNLLEHPAIVEVAVLGVPDEKWGEVPKAFVVLRDGEKAPEPEDLIAFMRERLAGYKVPRSYGYLDDLPRTATGKVQKFRLREADAVD